MATKVRKFDPHGLAAIRALLARRPGVSERKMFGYPAFFAGGRMFACLYGDGLAIKLPPRKMEAMLRRGEAAPFRPHGRAMSGWVHVRALDDEGLAAARRGVLAGLRHVSGKAQ